MGGGAAEHRAWAQGPVPPAGWSGLPRGRRGPATSLVSQVLELYGNEVASMACLCACPPPGLQHLGLGHNKLLGPSQSRYVTREHW